MNIKINKNQLGKNKVSVKSIKNYILVIVCGVLVVASVLMTVDTAASGDEIASLQKTEVNLTDQKRVLQESLVKGISMAQLQERSVELGFVKPTNLVYVSNSDNMTASTTVAVLP